MRLCPNSFTQCNFVSARLWRWCPLHFHQIARLFWGCQPRLTIGSGTETISGSNQIFREPRRFSASLQAGCFLTLSIGGMGLRTQTGYHAVFTR